MSLTLLGGAETRMRLAMVEPKLRAALRTNMRLAADPIVSQMRARSGRSTRIPQAIGVQTKFGERSAGVFIRVDSSKAPHARALNNRGVGGTFRHPVFGNREVWVDQDAMPFFENSAREGHAGVVAAAQAAIRIATE